MCAFSPFIPAVSPEGSGSAAEAWRRGKRTRQILADAAARGRRQPRHTLHRGPAHPSEQPEHGGSHRQNCPASRRSERVPGGEASDATCRELVRAVVLQFCLFAFQMVKLLLNKGANLSAIDKKERQPIHCAAYLGKQLTAQHIFSL